MFTSDAVVMTASPAENAGDLPCKFVRAAQMAAHEADGEFSLLIQHYDGGIGLFVLEQRSDGPDHDAGGHDENEIVIFAPEPCTAAWAELC